MEALLQMLLAGLVLINVEAQGNSVATACSGSLSAACLQEIRILETEITIQKLVNNELDRRLRTLEETVTRKGSEDENDRPTCRTSCPVGWDYYSHNRTSKSCYLFNTTKVQWHEASGRCIHASNNTATLVTISSINEFSYVTARMGGGSNKYWIGMHYNPSSRQWQWTSGEPVGYAHWRPGQPQVNPSRPADRCVLGNYFSAWGISDCTYPYPFVCEMPLQASC